MVFMEIRQLLFYHVIFTISLYQTPEQRVFSNVILEVFP